MNLITNLIKKICPICALTASTWVVLLILRYFGYPVSESLIALLMGGSAVGISYVLAKPLSAQGAKWWKLSGIPTAFLGMWLLLHYHVGWFIFVAIMYLLIYLSFKGRTHKLNLTPRSSESEVGKIEHELENCC